MPIAFRKLSHTYNEGTPFAYAALKDIDLNIPEGRITAIIGETGSGKSTLVQHLNALLLPTQAAVEAVCMAGAGAAFGCGIWIICLLVKQLCGQGKFI